MIVRTALKNIKLSRHKQRIKCLKQNLLLSGSRHFSIKNMLTDVLMIPRKNTENTVFSFIFINNTFGD